MFQEGKVNFKVSEWRVTLRDCGVIDDYGWASDNCDVCAGLQIHPCCSALYHKNTTWVGMNSRHTAPLILPHCVVLLRYCVLYKLKVKTLHQHVCKGGKSIPVRCR